MDVKIIVAIIGLISTAVAAVIAGYYKTRQDKETDERRVLHDLATDLVKDNTAKLMEQNNKLMERIDQIESKRDITEDEIDELRIEVNRLRIKIMTQSIALHSILLSAGQLIAKHANYTPDEFKVELMSHYEFIQNSIQQFES